MNSDMLQIDKQAVTEKDAEALLDASYLVRKPFGVPVMFVDPRDYPPKRFLGLPLPRLSMKRNIEKQLRDIILQCDEPAQNTKPVTIEDRGYFHEPRETLGKRIMRTVRDYHYYGDEHMGLAFPLASPRLSIVFQARIANGAEAEAELALSIPQNRLPPLPGFTAQHHFLSLWHEIAHSVSGSNEAGADLTGAMVYRHAFADSSVLVYQGDLRAANMIFQHHRPKVLETYGWSCVEAFDAVAARKTAPDRDEVIAAGYQSYSVPSLPRAGAIQTVGAALKKEFARAFLDRDLKMLSQAAADLAGNGTFETVEEDMIARRFSLATRRLAVGKAAY